MAEDPLVTHARTRIGRTLRGKWTLDKLLGVGGMAAVYECTHRNGSKVAIKMLHPNLMFETNFAQRLVQEGYVANKINHPAAVKVYDDDTDDTDGSGFLVVGLLPGQTIGLIQGRAAHVTTLAAVSEGPHPGWAAAPAGPAPTRVQSRLSGSKKVQPSCAACALPTEVLPVARKPVKTMFFMGSQKIILVPA